MKEIKDIIAAQDAAMAAGMKTALATVVQVEGSSYRREGARMLIREDGQLTGAISGGCLEGDALRKALLVMAQGEPMLVTYDTADEDDAKLGLGLGCNGIIRILIEPIHADDKLHPVALLKRVAEDRAPAVLVTLFAYDRKLRQPGTRLLLKAGYVLDNLADRALSKQIAADAEAVLNAGQSAVQSYGAHTAFLSLIAPPLSLIVVGGGNDAIPLAAIAHTLGWETTVVEGRPAYATQERFPTAARIIIGKPDIAMQQIIPDGRTAVVLMTHNYNYDLAMLRSLLPLNVLPYIGVLGPKKKLQRMLDELAAEGDTLDQAALSRVYGPTGLDIGASTPEEIALSIAAEIQSVLAGRSGAALRERTQSIHA